jgi:phosphomannomutase/phosphoglucomutase
MNTNIFREYDIRGVVPHDLTPELVIGLGRALGTFFIRNNAPTMVLGRDCRLSSPDVRDQLVRGLVETGMRVIDLGVCHTPLVYFSLFHLEKSAGVMITGSHNAPEYNGFKVCLGKTTIYGEQIRQLRDVLLRGDFESGSGTCEKRNIVPDYLDYLCGSLCLKRPLKVVIDAGNGTGGQIAVPLLQRMGCEVVELYCEMDGHFPHHHPDPTVFDNMRDLIDTVKSTRADVGISYDGDADRIGVVDDKGRIIRGDQLLLIFARSILEDSPGATFISEVKGSQVLYQEIERLGGRAIMWKTGHSLIKAKMQEEQALAAGEMSGHMFFAHRYFGFDDAVYATCRLLEIISGSVAPSSALLDSIPRTCATPEIRVDCPDHSKFAVVEQVKDALRGRYPLNDIDGVRVDMPGGWGLVRASNTQPALVMRFESLDAERLNEIRREIETIVCGLLSSTTQASASVLNC